MSQPSQPFVIVISGSVGAGKSTIAAALAKRLGDAPILSFDHYGQYVEWPPDLIEWVKNGADPSLIRVPKLKDDLLALMRSEVIADPMNGKVVTPANCILLEEPSGREREEIKEYIDLVVYIDVPQDVCVLRMIERALHMEVWNSMGTFEGESRENLVHQLDSVALWISQYQRARLMYMQVSRIVKEKADVVVNGMDSIHSVTSNILSKIKDKLGVLD